MWQWRKQQPQQTVQLNWPFCYAHLLLIIKQSAHTLDPSVNIYTNRYTNFNFNFIHWIYKLKIEHEIIIINEYHTLCYQIKRPHLNVLLIEQIQMCCPIVFRSQSLLNMGMQIFAADAYICDAHIDQIQTPHRVRVWWNEFLIWLKQFITKAQTHTQCQIQCFIETLPISVLWNFVFIYFQKIYTLIFIVNFNSILISKMKIYLCHTSIQYRFRLNFLLRLIIERAHTKSNKCIKWIKHSICGLFDFKNRVLWFCFVYVHLTFKQYNTI